MKKQSTIKSGSFTRYSFGLLYNQKRMVCFVEVNKHILSLRLKI